MKEPSSNEHEIGYAYPSSPAATRHGFGKQGCYTIKVGNTQDAFATKDQALQQAVCLGTTPGRWSIDIRLTSSGI